MFVVSGRHLFRRTTVHLRQFSEAGISRRNPFNLTLAAAPNPKTIQRGLEIHKMSQKSIT